MDDESVTGRAIQRAYDKSVRGEVDAQGDYDTFIQEVVIPNERWEQFVDHDIQRLRKLIDDGGDAGVEAAELLPEVQEVRDTQARRALSSLASFDKEYKEVRGCLTKQYHTQASLINHARSPRGVRHHLPPELIMKIAGHNSKAHSLDKPLKLPLGMHSESEEGGRYGGTGGGGRGTGRGSGSTSSGSSGISGISSGGRGISSGGRGTSARGRGISSGISRGRN
ncbi:hypothetical protein EPUS_07811 [Endocarpon pusillum Z07020]|uniref:Uncharacterized protein n=1 Tax=Endocarpon pusillum (strain Z07020 / HMAS-L-300199) TaxID=1263415 RepID=U1GC42_ENDPU|nr:uncharacterized protein EPUS_07811 [Endocarpon pusillum Z07020]ERF75122.1 hypothetical protein EPUS_07811 [Endocarpon pusillum Z07020]